MQLMMKKTAAALAALLLAIALPMASATPALAAGDCRVRVEIEDRTGGAFKDVVNVTFLSDDGTDVANISLKAGGSASGKIKKGTAYNVAVFFQDRDGFEIRNPDGTAIGPFTASGASYDFHWAVSARPRALETGKELWDDFVGKVRGIDTDERFSSMFEYFYGTIVVANRYNEVTGGDTEAFMAFTPFERYLWYATYLRPLYPSLTEGNYSFYYSTLGRWEYYTVGNEYSTLAKYGDEEQAEAYKKLMRWQYEYFTTNGSMFNFLTWRDSIDAGDGGPYATPSGRPAQEGGISEGFVEGVSVNGAADVIEAKKPAKLIGLLIMIICLLAGGAGGALIYRKIKQPA